MSRHHLGEFVAENRGIRNLIDEKLRLLVAHRTEYERCPARGEKFGQIILDFKLDAARDRKIKLSHFIAVAFSN